MESFRELDVEKYQIIATFDLKTSKICQEMDKKIFNIDDMEIGKNAPPFHPRCRTTTAPYTEKRYFTSTRAARDADGKTVQIPEDMTYKEWFELYGKDYKAKQDEILKKKKECEKAKKKREKEQGEKQQEKEEKELQKQNNSDTINTGAKRNHTFAQKEEHAEKMYLQIAKRKNDCEKIANNTGFKKSDIVDIKNHMFIYEHKFKDGSIKKFDPDFEQAQAWDRLTQGKHTDLDILLLNHELTELNLIKKIIGAMKMHIIKLMKNIIGSWQ